MTAPARPRYRVVIVGAGIVGLYTSYYLARAGAGPILVIDRGFLSGGASGRNGGGVRQQWETRATVRLAREAIRETRRFGTEFGYNVWFRQGGYLFLAGTPQEFERLRQVHGVVASEGLNSRLLDPAGAARMSPGSPPTGSSVRASSTPTARSIRSPLCGASTSARAPLGSRSSSASRRPASRRNADVSRRSRPRRERSARTWW